MRLNRVVAGTAVLILALVNGCGFMPQSGSNNKGKLEGTRWVNEPGVFAGVPLVRGAFTMDFRGDGTFYWRFSDMIITGTFSYGPDDLIFFTLSKPFLNRTDWKEHVTIAGDNMVMGGEDGITINFYRYKTTTTPTSTAKETSKENVAPPPPEQPKQVAGDNPRRKITKPQELMPGEWGVFEMALNGTIYKQERYKDNRVVFTGDKIQFLEKGKIVTEATYKCDFTKDPAEIDVKYLSGEKKGQTELGVVRVTDSVLEFTLAEQGQPRPTEFNAPQGWKRTRILLYWLK